MSLIIREMLSQAVREILCWRRLYFGLFPMFRRRRRRRFSYARLPFRRGRWRRFLLLVLDDQSDAPVAGVIGVGRVPETLVGETPNLGDLIFPDSGLLHPSAGGVSPVA